MFSFRVVATDLSTNNFKVIHHEVFVDRSGNFINDSKFIGYFATLELSRPLILKNLSTAIECQFRMEEDVPNYPLDEQLTNLNEILFEKSNSSNLQPFECDEPKVSSSEEDLDPVSRSNGFMFDFTPPLDDGYEPVTVCESVKIPRRPRAMTNTENKMVSVVNTNEIVQEILTEECV